MSRISDKVRSISSERSRPKLVSTETKRHFKPIPRTYTKYTLLSYKSLNFPAGFVKFTLKSRTRVLCGLGEEWNDKVLRFIF